jgi:hypothetical protein
MTFTIARGVNLVQLRVALKLRPMAEFDPDKPARIYDYLNERFFDWDPKNAEHYRQTARPFKDKGYEELTAYDGVELLGWYAARTPPTRVRKRAPRSWPPAHGRDGLGKSTRLLAGRVGPRRGAPPFS